MDILRHSVILPCDRLEDFPTQLSGDQAAELLGAWTALWHPSLLAVTGTLPGWHPATDPPEPEELDWELILLPDASRHRLAMNWCERLEASGPHNPPPVHVFASRAQTIAAMLAAAGMEPGLQTDLAAVAGLNSATDETRSNKIAAGAPSAEIVADFLALGFGHLHVELLTRSMRYASVLDRDQFTDAVIGAAQAAVAGDDANAHDEIARAFDLLMDARNHVYAVDIYLVDVTLLAESTLGEPLRTKLASRIPTSLLAPGELIERMAATHPDTLAELRETVEAGTACICGGMLHDRPTAGMPPETLLAELIAGQEIVRTHVGRSCGVFGQFSSAFSPQLPDVLDRVGITAALHAAFDGSRLQRAEQCKTKWGTRDRAEIDVLSTVPLDVARADTWLKLSDKIGDTIAHDHVATVVLAGWPGAASEFYEDLRRISKFCPLLGTLVTLDEYFRVTREVDDWSTFHPREYPAVPPARENPISSRIDEYRREIAETYGKLAIGFDAVALATLPATDSNATSAVVTNAWNFSAPRFVATDVVGGIHESADDTSADFADVPGCGFARIAQPDTAARRGAPPIVVGRILRNELLEVTVSQTTGGLQSIKLHTDRSTRVSQRLVYESGDDHYGANDGYLTPPLSTRMIADCIETTHNDGVVGEITTQGRLEDSLSESVARFRQTVRLALGLPAVIVDVELEPLRTPLGPLWQSYFASRLAWKEEGPSVRRGVEWVARTTGRREIESPEWVELSDGSATITCFGMGLPFHRLVGPTWLDTLLIVANEERRRFQFAIGLDCQYPTQASLALATCGTAQPANWPGTLSTDRGWFLHVGAKNVLMTHLEPLSGNLNGVRLRLLETEGRAVQTTMKAYRPFQTAKTTDFRGQSRGLLSVEDGAVRLEVGPHQWIQVEAEW